MPDDLPFDRFDAMTFDCYGTLIDWEAGIAAGLRRFLEPRQVQPPTDELLETYAEFEAAAEAGPYRPYREILAAGARGVAERYGVDPTDVELATFGASVGDWPAFPDSADALGRLQVRFRLGVITNCDDDLFAASNDRLGVEFDWVVTAQQARSYKPSPRNFELAFERIGLSRDRILHVAQSLYHDHVPAKRLGLTTVWVDRRRAGAGPVATPPAEATPDLTVPDMASLVDAALR